MEKAKKGILILEDFDSTLGQKQRTLKGLCHMIFHDKLRGKISYIITHHLLSSINLTLPNLK